MLAAEFFLNKKAFDGKEITNETDGMWDKTKAVADWAWKSWMPSAPWVPESWYWTAISEALRGVRDASGQPKSLTQAIASSAGIKLRSHDLSMARKFRALEFDKLERELRERRSALFRDRQSGRVAEDDFGEENRKLGEKFRALNQRRREVIGGATAGQ